VGGVIESFLEPVEVLERALSDFEGQGEDPRVLGLQMATRALRETLARHGLETVPGVGAAFDHNVHEAIAREAAEAPEGTILEVVRSGYRLDGRLLRPALVKVSAGPA
jgi:molecular chaperone GrpE